MELKRSLIGACALAAILGFTNVEAISAQENVDEGVATEISVEFAKDNHDGQKRFPCKHGGKGIFMQSVEELQKDGTLSEKDIEKIQEFRQKEREEIKQKILEEKNSKVDEMVNQNVITKEQGEKLKKTMEKNINNLGKESR